MDNEMRPEEGAGCVALHRQARTYRSTGNFGAVAKLLQTSYDRIAQGQAEPAEQVELELQEYWTAETLAAYGKEADTEGAADALRQALIFFAPATPLPPILNQSPEAWQTTIDTCKRTFVEQQLAKARTAGDQVRQALWLAELGDMACEQGRLAAAQQDLDEALALAPAYAHLWAYRGEIQRHRQQYPAALADFTRAIELDDQNAWAIASRGQVYLALDREDEAFKAFEQALALDPTLAWVWAERGECYRLRKHYPEAVADFDRALALDGEDGWAMRQRGQSYMGLGEYEQALADFARALDLDGEQRELLLARGELYLLREAFDRALLDFARLLVLDPQNPWAWGRRSLIRRRLGQYTQALAEIEQAIQRDRDQQQHSWYLYCRGLIHLCQGQAKPAAKDFTQAIKGAAALYAKDKTSTTNQFNLLLYALAAQHNEDVTELLPQLLSKIDSRHFLNMALFLVADLRTVIPDQPQAVMVQQQLQALAENQLEKPRL